VEQILKEMALDTALVVEAVAVVIVAYGALEAVFYAVGPVVRAIPREAGWRKATFVRFGMWLLLGLQFALAADIVRTIIAPTWNDIGQLAAIAVIRTFLNYFLERDMEEFERAEPSK
jgi:uncharacterized membrane protein